MANSSRQRIGHFFYKVKRRLFYEPQIVLVANLDAVLSQHLESFGELENKRGLKKLELVSRVLLVDCVNFSSALGSETFEDGDKSVADFSQNFVIVVSEINLT